MDKYCSEIVSKSQVNRGIKRVEDYKRLLHSRVKPLKELRPLTPHLMIRDKHQPIKGDLRNKCCIYLD
jgi:hypothetical protein